METKTIEIPIYRDKDGRQVCGSDFQSGKICPLFRVTRFGTVGICGWSERQLVHDGYCRPDNKCPVRVEDLE